MRILISYFLFVANVYAQHALARGVLCAYGIMMDWITKRHVVSYRKIKDRVSSLLHPLVNNCCTRV